MSDRKSILEKLGIVQKIEIDLNEGGIPEAPAVSMEEEDVIELCESYEYEPEIDPDYFSSIQELYEKYRLPLNGTNTIFIADSYSKALPDNLPPDVKRQTVLNVLAASGIDVELLVKDGMMRASRLNSFMDVFTKRTEKVIKECETEIKRLEAQIVEYKKIIEGRQRLQEKQLATVEYETEKLGEIVEFVNK